MHKKAIKKLWESTIAKAVLIIILLVLPINIITLLLVQIVMANNQEQINTEIQNSLDVSVSNFESSLDFAYKRLLLLSVTDVDVREMSGGLEKLSYSEKSRLVNSVSDHLREITSEYATVDLVYYYFPQNGYLIKSGYPKPPYDDYKKAIVALWDSEGGNQYLWHTLQIKDVPVVISAKTWQNVQFGVLINLDSIVEKLNLPEFEDDRCVFVTDGEETIISDEGISFLEEEGLTYQELLESNKFNVYMSPLQSRDLSVVEVVRKSSLAGSISNTIQALQIMAVILTISAIPLLLFVFRRWIWTPLSNLTSAMDRIEQGNLDYRINEKEKSKEFQRINHNFNQMMDQVQNLKIDVYEKEIDKKNITMEYLSHQIQPHFILNAMNILYSYEPEEYELSQKMILCISKYFRYIVKMNARFVCLRQEMDHIKNYFEIQKARFPGLFFSIVEYEEALGDALIPPLLVQNFVENSIKHSLKAGNKITILVIGEYYKMEGEPTQMRIRIADTGEGIPDEVLEEIRVFQETGNPQEHLGVGIQNAIERLKYLYNDPNTRIRFWRDEHYRGTNVELILPIHYEIQDENPDGRKKER